MVAKLIARGGIWLMWAHRCCHHWQPWPSCNKRPTIYYFVLKIQIEPPMTRSGLDGSIEPWSGGIWLAVSLSIGCCVFLALFGYSLLELKWLRGCNGWELVFKFYVHLRVISLANSPWNLAGGRFHVEKISKYWRERDLLVKPTG